MVVESNPPTDADNETKQELDDDEARLAKLGYKQEYRRVFSLWTNFGLSSSMVSVLLGVIPLYTYALVTGGSAVLVWSWVIVGFMTLFVVSSMAEICAAFPTMGALYYWSYRLGGPKWGPFASWTAGWCNLLGQVGGVASGGYSGALVIADIVQITTNTNLDQYQIFGLYAATLALAGLVNAFPQFLTSLCWISVVWHNVGILIIIILMNCFAPTHQTVGWVLTDFNNATNFTSNFYVGLIGFLPAASVFTGYDTAAHVAEETRQSHNSSPWAMIGSVVNCLILGLILIIGMNFAIQNIDDLTDADNPNGAATTLWLQLLGVPLTVFLNVIIFVAIECSNCANLTSCARMVYSFSRDGALPFSNYWHNVNPWTGSPVRAIALSVVVSFLVALPGLAISAILGALFSLCATGLLASYIIPILLRITVSRHTFVPVEFNLGRWAVPCGTIAVGWSFLMLVLVCLPQETPINGSTLNYAPVMLGVMLVGAWSAWFLSARKWFKGIPAADLSAPSDVSPEEDPEAPDPEAPECTMDDEGDKAPPAPPAPTPSNHSTPSFLRSADAF